jgi:hypothetical protein
VALAAAPDDDAYTDHFAGATLGHLSPNLLHLVNHLITGFTTKTPTTTNPYLFSVFTAAALQSSDCKFNTWTRNEKSNDTILYLSQLVNRRSSTKQNEILDLVDVNVANPTVQDLHHHILWTSLPANYQKTIIFFHGKNATNSFKVSSNWRIRAFASRCRCKVTGPSSPTHRSPCFGWMAVANEAESWARKRNKPRITLENEGKDLEAVALFDPWSEVAGRLA